MPNVDPLDSDIPVDYCVSDADPSLCHSTVYTCI